MNQIKPVRIFVVFIIFLIFIAGIVCLRFNELIDSRDLSLLTTVFLVAGFVAIFFEKISEITLIGNTVKLQQINEKSEQLLEQLRVEHFKLRIDSAFAPTNFFSGGDSVFTCRVKLFEIAKDIKEAELLTNPELKEKLLPLLTNHAVFHLDHIKTYGSELSPNPLEGLVDPQDLINAFNDELVNTARVEGVSSNVAKMTKMLENIDIYKNLITAKSWYEV